MTKIRMNTELRNKLFNKIKHVFENENTQERENYLQAREDVNKHYVVAHQLAKQVVERAYPPEDVSVLRSFKKKYGSPCDVVAKDKCFYFAHNKGVDDEGEPTETKSHFDFGLFGNLNGSEYGSDEGKKFAVAYFREDLKAMDCNPDIFAQQNDNKDNPHKTKQVDSITKQCDQLKIGLKAYRYLSEAIELATELGIEIEEAELIRTNSTGLTIYNPKNLADMIKGLKNNKPLTLAQKIEARKKYEAVN